MSSPTENLLIVEDDVFLALDAESSARTLGCAPFIANSRGEALKLLNEREFRAAVLDFQLEDGISADVAKQLDEMGVPYCVVSGSDAERISATGIPKSRIVSKPARYNKIIEGLLASATKSRQVVAQ